MYRAMVASTAQLAAAWQSCGFTHGVLNTDNMSVLGLTLDYGPFGFLERTEQDYVPNGSDDQGRYSFGNQPAACRWNCMKLGEALAPYLPAGCDWRAELAQFSAIYAASYLQRMRSKLGLAEPAAGTEQQAVEAAEQQDRQLIGDLLGIMEASGADYSECWGALAEGLRPLCSGPHPETPIPNPLPLSPPALSPPAALTFRGLGAVGPEAPSSGEEDAALSALLQHCCLSAADFAEATAPSLPLPRLQMLRLAAQSNPRSPPEQLAAIEAALQEHAAHAALAARSRAQKRQADAELWAPWLLRYRGRLRADAAGSSAEAASAAAARSRAMACSNPLVIPRTWLLQVAIEAAEKGDFLPVRQLLEQLTDPYGLAAGAGAGSAAGSFFAGLPASFLAASAAAEKAQLEALAGSSCGGEQGSSSSSTGSAASEAAQPVKDLGYYMSMAPPGLRKIRLSCSS
jgi:hypothetical protein